MHSLRRANAVFCDSIPQSRRVVKSKPLHVVKFAQVSRKIEPCKVALTKHFVHGDGNAVGQVETTVIGSHRKPDTVCFLKKLVNFGGKPFCFGTENKEISGHESGC